MKQLNNPKIIPSCLPSNEFVRIVNGIVIKAIQAIPNRAKAMIDVNFVVPKATIRNPIPPKIKLTVYAGRRVFLVNLAKNKPTTIATTE